MPNRSPQQSARLSAIGARMADGSEVPGQTTAHRAPTALSFNEVVQSYQNAWNSGRIMFSQIPSKFQAAAVEEV